MDKRRFLATGALMAVAATPARAAADPAARGPGLLTVSGPGVRANRGPLDPALDQLLVKHGAQFERAHVFDAAALARLPAVAIQPTLEYDAKPHTLRGPLVTRVVEAAGIAPNAAVTLGLRAIDGYTVELPLADAAAMKMIVATAIDGAPMAVGGLGPLWAVVDADRLPALKVKPLKERYAQCPWGLYSIEVKPR